MENRKVVIIGDGAVGSSIAFSLVLNNAINEIVIIDVNKNKALGDALDLNHGMSLTAPKKIKAGEYDDILGAHIIILACGVSQKEGETRLELLARNEKIFDSVFAGIKPYLDKDAIVLVVTNPVDVLALYTYKKLGLPANQVIGSGTVLDTARLKFLLSQETGIDPRSIHAYVIGEHGDSEVAAFSVTSIAGVSIKDYCHSCGKCLDCGLKKLGEIAYEVKNSAYDIIKMKGATYYGIALAVNRIIESIVNDQHSVLTVSTYIESEFDGQIKDVYLSLPCVLTNRGVKEIIRPNYSKEEIAQLIKSARILKETNI